MQGSDSGPPVSTSYKSKWLYGHCIAAFIAKVVIRKYISILILSPSNCHHITKQQEHSDQKIELFFISKVKWTAATGLIHSLDLFFIYRCTFSLAGTWTEWIFTTKTKSSPILAFIHRWASLCLLGQFECIFFQHSPDASICNVQLAASGQGT